jgi:hypothetical protein
LLNGFPPVPDTQWVSGKNHVEIPAHIKGNEMIANGLLFAIVILLGYGFWLLDQLEFMARYMAVLFHA